MVSNVRLERILLEKIIKQAKKEFNKRVIFLKKQISPIIYEAVYNSSEMSSVRSGFLRLDFGLRSDPTPAISKAIADSCSIEIDDVRLAGNKIVGGLTVSIQPKDYLNILNIPQAFNVIENGVKLPWLEWLVLYGSQIVIINFGVTYGSGLGRTGGAIMTEEARPFRVNPVFAGDSEDNFITRSIEKSIPNISKAIQRIL
jgi:hypothetical protein